MRKALTLTVSLITWPAIAADPTYFAKVVAGTVSQVIVADQSFIDSGKAGAPQQWVETWIDGRSRKNYAAPGFTYDDANNRFVPPKPSNWPSWTLNPGTARWQAPRALPPQASEHVRWNEQIQDWEEPERPQNRSVR